MSLGGNLTYSPRPILINTLTAHDFGVYTDTVLNQKVLFLKKHGFAFPYRNAAGTVVSSVTKVTGKAATRKVALVLLGTECPCEECNFEYGYSLARIVKNPGVLNSERYEHVVTYAGKLKAVTCTNGVIDSTYVDAMRNDLIDQISGHVSYSKQGFDSVATASLAKILTFDNTKVLSINGEVVDVAGLTRAQAVALVNATAATLVTAYEMPASISSTAFVLVAADGTKTITLTNTTMTIDANNYIAHVAKEDDVTFEVQDPTGGVTSITVVPNAFSQMTPDDVYREFSHAAHDGHLANQHRVEIPLNVWYTKYIFKQLMKTASIHGASHGNDYLEEVHVYIPTSYLDDDIWDATNLMWASTADNAGFSADQTLDEIITTWKS